MRRVIIESPYAGDTKANVIYARAAMYDSLHRGEAPLASHLLYTQPGVLDDLVPEERKLGIEAGYAWLRRAELVAFYIDRGWSKGMLDALKVARVYSRPVEVRSLHCTLAHEQRSLPK